MILPGRSPESGWPATRHYAERPRASRLRHRRMCFREVVMTAFVNQTLAFRLRVLFAAFLLSVVAAYAQGTGTCTVTGTVYDGTGAVVPQAKVQLTLTTTDTTRDTTADSSGFFSFVGVPAGTYAFKADASGFASFSQKDIVLHINDQVDLRNIVLKVAGTATAGGVTAGTPVFSLRFGGAAFTNTPQQG